MTRLFEADARMLALIEAGKPVPMRLCGLYVLSWAYPAFILCVVAVGFAALGGS